MKKASNKICLFILATVFSCILVTFSLTGCSIAPQNTENSIVSEERETADVTELLRGIHIASSYENLVFSDYQFWYFLGYQGIETDTVSFEYYTNGNPLDECKVSKEKAEDIFNIFRNARKEYYEPYHANEDGLMVTEYKPYSIKIFNSFYDEQGNRISNTKDERYDEKRAECFYALSESDYNALLNELNNLVKSYEKSRANVS